MLASTLSAKRAMWAKICQLMLTLMSALAHHKTTLGTAPAFATALMLATKSDAAVSNVHDEIAILSHLQYL